MGYAFATAPNASFIASLLIATTATSMGYALTNSALA
jgi:hypothetical protein